MPAHYRALLAVARQLQASAATADADFKQTFVRRSISTAYYAIFHFVQEECGRYLVGAEAPAARRVMFSRTLSHTGTKTALQKITGGALTADLADFLLPPGTTEVPAFAIGFAKTFVQVQHLRHEADYDLNAVLTELDAARTIVGVQVYTDLWLKHDDGDDRSVKHALCLLMVLGGKLRGG